MDWIKTGWGPELSLRFDPEKNYYLDFTNAVYSTRSAIDICIDAIDKICKNYPAPYTLMVSGGIDSQAMIWCWKHTQVPFNVVTVRYVDNNGNVLNEHDISNIRQFSSLYNITVDYLDFNIVEFLENYLLDYAIKYQCTSPQITTYMCMSEMIHQGTVLFSGDFLATAVYSYTIYGLKRYADISKRNVIPFFLLHDPELTTLMSREYHTLTTKEYIDMADKRDSSMDRIYNKKVKAITRLGIPIVPQTIKYSGFEKVKDLYDNRNDLISVNDRLKYSNMPSKRIFDIAFRYKLGEIIKYEDIVCMR
jgi:hypothetical protein